MNIVDLAIKRPVFITCIVTLMLVLGLSGLSKMSVDQFPDVTFPVVAIQVGYPGASPQDVEKLISKPIEDEISGLARMKRLSSNSLDSFSVIIAEFELGTDIKTAEQQIRDRVMNIRRNLPTDILDPVIRRFDPADQPIIRLAVTSNLPIADLYDLLDEEVRTQFERIEGVGQVQLIGARKREIHVNVDKQKLQDRKISLLQVSSKIEATSKDVPIGKVEDPRNQTVLRTNGEFDSLKSLGQVNVNFFGSDRAVLLKDIGEVIEGLEDEKTRGTLNGKPALYMEVYKQSGANTVRVSDKVNSRIEIVNEFLKVRSIDAKVELVRDGSFVIRNNITDVYESIIIGALLCIIVVFFFLGSARSTFITGMALPNSLLGAFVLMYACGFTINIMTLLALSLAVGLLIDDAIVVRENIFRHLEMGETPMAAARKGTLEVAQAVVATTLVVIAVFGPIAFLEGIIGQFFKQFGLTIVFAMLISMFDAFTMAPMLSAYMATANEHVRGKGFVASILNQFDRFQTWLENLYISSLTKTMKRPLMVLIGAFFIFIGSLALLAKIPKTFLPTPDNGEFLVQIEAPIGSSLEYTAGLADRVEKVVMDDPTVELSSKVVGTYLSESNKANIYVRLVKKKHRKQNTSEIKTAVRKKVEQFQKEGSVLISDVDISGGGQKPFNFVIRGQNLEELAPYVDKLVTDMKKIPGLTDVDTNFRTGAPEFQVGFDRTRAEDLGISTGTAGAELRARVEGIVPAVFRAKGREYDVRVRLTEKDRDLRKEFDSTLVPNANGNMIPLNQVAHRKEVVGYSQINRQNKGRYIMVTGNLDAGASLDSIMKQTEDLVKTNTPPPGIETSFLGQAQDLQDLLTNMLMAILLGVIFIYLVLASLYESFITPFTILLALPLAVCGALMALFVTGKSIDIFSMIGIVMLLGVVAKNSILLVDYANKLVEEEGKSVSEALFISCRTRLRPILMTSLALIAGMIPIAIGLNEASAVRTSMGVAIIGGLISSTFLTLYVVPAAYGYMHRFSIWLTDKVMRQLRGQDAPPVH